MCEYLSLLFQGNVSDLACVIITDGGSTFDTVCFSHHGFSEACRPLPFTVSFITVHLMVKMI